MTTLKEDTLDEILKLALSRTCEHKGCKLAICNHAYNNVKKDISDLITKHEVEALESTLKVIENPSFERAEAIRYTKARLSELQKKGQS